MGTSTAGGRGYRRLPAAGNRPRSQQSTGGDQCPDGRRCRADRHPVGIERAGRKSAGRVAGRRTGQSVPNQFDLPRVLRFPIGWQCPGVGGLSERRPIQSAVCRFRQLGPAAGYRDRQDESARVEPGIWAECAGRFAIDPTQEWVHMERWIGGGLWRFLRHDRRRISVWDPKRRHLDLCSRQFAA